MSWKTAYRSIYYQGAPEPEDMDLPWSETALLVIDVQNTYLDRPDRNRCYIYRHYGHGHGDTDLNDALARSCNVYFFQAARTIGSQPIIKWADCFGFGQPTGIDLPGEAAGHVPRPPEQDTPLVVAGFSRLVSPEGGSSGAREATAAGTLLGAFLGNQIGRSLDRVDQMHAEETAQAALERYPDGSSATWQNPNTGHSGYTVPTSTYQTPQGQYCREYQSAVVIDGQTQSAHGTACRQPDGTWQVMS